MCAEKVAYHSLLQKYIDRFNNKNVKVTKYVEEIKDILGKDSVESALFIAILHIFAYGDNAENRLKGNKEFNEPLYKAAKRLVNNDLSLSNWQFDTLFDLVVMSYELGETTDKITERVYRYSIFVSQATRTDYNYSKLNEIKSTCSTSEQFYKKVGDIKRNGKVTCSHCGEIKYGYQMARGKRVCLQCSRAERNNPKEKTEKASKKAIREGVNASVEDSNASIVSGSIENIRYYLNSARKAIIEEATLIKDDDKALDEVCKMINDFQNSVLKEALKNGQA